MAPFYGWGSTASRLVPLRGGSLHFATNLSQILPPRYSWYSFYRTWKDERLSRPWRHPVVLNTGPLVWESHTLTTRPKPFMSPSVIYIQLNAVILSPNYILNSGVYSSTSRSPFTKTQS